MLRALGAELASLPHLAPSLRLGQYEVDFAFSIVTATAANEQRYPGRPTHSVRTRSPVIMSSPFLVRLSFWCQAVGPA